MLAHLAGSILLLIVAVVVASVVGQEYESMPALVILLLVSASVVIFAIAAKLFLAGLRRKKMTVGPRTKLVLDDSGNHPKPARRSATSVEHGD